MIFPFCKTLDDYLMWKLFVSNEIYLEILSDSDNTNNYSSPKHNFDTKKYGSDFSIEIFEQVVKHHHCYQDKKPAEVLLGSNSYVTIYHPELDAPDSVDEIVIYMVYSFEDNKLTLHPLNRAFCGVPEADELIFKMVHEGRSFRESLEALSALGEL